MLRYLGSGQRKFGLHPMYVHRRANWEFFAVLRGRCGAVLPDQPRPHLQSRRLWVFPPDNAHGWVGQGPGSCEVAIFHFGTVPDVLDKAARERGYLSQPITSQQARWLARLTCDLQPHFERVTERSLLVFERALLGLSLLALEQIPAERTEARTDFALRKVEAALTWYAEHMLERPKLEHVAQAASVSVRHLRRLFWDARRESPQAAFTKLRLHRGMEMLSQSNLKLEAIAAECGFSSSSDFCRVFKAAQRISPDAWRRKVLRRCNVPGQDNPAVA